MRFVAKQAAITRGVSEILSESEVSKLITKHYKGDWGDSCEEDKKINEDALKYGNRVMSVFNEGNNTLWVITEADRSVTTVLLPEEY